MSIGNGIKGGALGVLLSTAFSAFGSELPSCDTLDNKHADEQPRNIIKVEEAHPDSVQHIQDGVTHVVPGDDSPQASPACSPTPSM